MHPHKGFRNDLGGSCDESEARIALIKNATSSSNIILSPLSKGSGPGIRPSEPCVKHFYGVLIFLCQRNKVNGSTFSAVCFDYFFVPSKENNWTRTDFFEHDISNK